MRGIYRGLIAIASMAVMAGAPGGAIAVADAPTGSWTPITGPPAGAAFPSATVLANGKVLFAGGAASGTIVNQFSVVYDPAANAWSSLAATNGARFGATAVTLQSGKVLLVGGRSDLSNATASNTGEVYDPATNIWSGVSNTMSSARANNPVAQLLPSGRVLITGGTNTTGVQQATADLYDPAQNKFVAAHAMGTAREQAAWALLPSGKVLVAGGTGTGTTPLDTGEVYDPTSDTWTAVANHMTDPRGFGPGAATLPNGKVIVMGGVLHLSPTSTSATADLYNPATNTFAPAASMHTSRTDFAIGSLADGRVLVAGGEVVANGAAATVVPDAELYDPVADAWRVTAPLPNPTAAPAAVALPSGQVLVLDGAPSANTNDTRSVAALYTPATVPTAPLFVSATAGAGSAFVSFAPPVSNGGSPIVNYTITTSTGKSVTTPDARTATTITGLTPGQPVSFTVVARNALGGSPASAASNAITPLAPAPPPDQAPTVTIAKLATKLKLKSFLKGVSFVAMPNKPAALEVSLIGTVNGATIARVFNLTLAQRQFGLSGKPRTVTLVPAKGRVGRPRSTVVELVIVATDAAGSRSTTTRTIRVSR